MQSLQCVTDCQIFLRAPFHPLIKKKHVNVAHVLIVNRFLFFCYFHIFVFLFLEWKQPLSFKNLDIFGGGGDLKKNNSSFIVIPKKEIYSQTNDILDIRLINYEGKLISNEFCHWDGQSSFERIYFIISFFIFGGVVIWQALSVGKDSFHWHEENTDFCSSVFTAFLTYSSTPEIDCTNEKHSCHVKWLLSSKVGWALSLI